MNTVTSHLEILKALPTNPEAVKGLSAVKNETSCRWLLDKDGLLKLDNHIYISCVRGTLDFLCIKVLQILHDYILSSHFG